MDITHIIDTLNPEQRMAATSLDHNLLVLAGAGSGKTKTIVHRTAYLIITGQAHWHQILTVTFTNKAANELKSRVSRLLPNQQHAGTWTGTFHSICHKLLRIHAEEIGLPKNFQVIDTDDQLRIVKKIHKEMHLDEQQWPAKKSLNFINQMKEQGHRSFQCQDQSSAFYRTCGEVYASYEEHCSKNHLVDFAELILKTTEMLRDNEDIRWQYQTQFKHILIDEFQDTNKLQYTLISLLKHEQQRIVAVGDDDQSIYSWRGAIVDHMFSFEKDFSPVTTIRLEQNYRSTQNILNAANHIIQHNEKRLEKKLWTDSSSKEKIKLYAAYNETDEAQFVCDQIHELIRRGHTFEDCAILYRSNAQSRVFEEKLSQATIPYRVYGGLRFFERAEIKDIIAYLRLMANQQDNYAFERSINQPPRGIGRVTLDKIKHQAQLSAASFLDASQQCNISGKAAPALQLFYQLITDSIHQFGQLSLLIEHVIKETKMIAYLQAQKNHQTDAKVENLKELVSAAKHYDQYDSIQEALNEFLSHAVLDQNPKNEHAASQVQLMTLHSAKGLEFPNVFLTGLEDDLFPHKMTHADHKQIEEERRLCYVGITRAKQELYISYAETRRLYGQEMYQRPSRFIRELPQEELEYLRGNNAYTPKPKVKASYTFQLGQTVSHAKFGEGVVLNYEEDGDNSRVQVRFLNHGVKWLLCAYAKLNPV
ncbi:UvrD-helicase domain-containing protein [Candidatus Synchoanobacter obligatus]|uniref:DNA 3'-5' helicase n=1 Tax=Candidatus Synchoanobacter obligatus TaxID=2919597 RepID=A0ABT1L4E6_9GAMM|nr:UvrD-helicase domain-containing protein [Candidatus Synchoanobacter obligatus]MCP8352049.1 UvrD-helicase domain-containing protein [Candidatus Synchoanobacter obligatus]